MSRQIFKANDNQKLNRYKFLLPVLLLSMLNGLGSLRAMSAAKEVQPIFAKRRIKIDGKSVTVEIADNEARREYGLMYRKELGANSGMLFVFEFEDMQNFWMKNTLIPLSIGYFDKNRKLLEVYEMVPNVLGERLQKTYPSHSPAMYALEMPKGWFKKHGVKAGATFTFVGK